MPICLLYTPANIRYATGTDVMGVWTVSTFARFCMVPAQGEPVLFEYKNSMHVSEQIMDDVRPAINWQFLGVEGGAEAAEWAKTVKDAMRELGCEGAPLAIDKLDGFGFQALQHEGIGVTDASPATVDARQIKTPEEIDLMVINGAIGDAMMAEFEAAIRPGIREYELLAIHNDALFRLHGEFLFTRLVASGSLAQPRASSSPGRKATPRGLGG